MRERNRTNFGLAITERVGEPGPGERPVPVCGPTGKAEGLGGVTQRHPGEKPQLDQFGGDGELISEPVEGVVEFKKLVVSGGGRTGELVEIDAIPPTAPLQPGTVPGVVDQHPPHRLGGGGEEVRFVVEVLVPDQPHVSLMNQGGGVEGVPRFLGGHLRSRELPQLVVDEREQVGRSLLITGRGGFEEVSDLGHNDRVYRVLYNVQTVGPELFAVPDWMSRATRVGKSVWPNERIAQWRRNRESNALS